MGERGLDVKTCLAAYLGVGADVQYLLTIILRHGDI
jgi:hypothetical protein